jgi:uncharacterized membrane protein YdbT with pleckstrin-like domain
MRVRPSWWHFAFRLFVAAIPLMAAGEIFLSRRTQWQLIPLLCLASAVLFGLVFLVRYVTSWSLTSERLIERKGLLATRRRELELADIRSVEVDRTLAQKLAGLGDVTVASAASADFSIRMVAVPDPDGVAETIRQARLKRLA